MIFSCFINVETLLDPLSVHSAVVGIVLENCFISDRGFWEIMLGHLKWNSRFTDRYEEFCVSQWNIQKPDGVNEKLFLCWYSNFEICL